MDQGASQLSDCCFQKEAFGQRFVFTHIGELVMFQFIPEVPGLYFYVFSKIQYMIKVIE
jgi:hypothetical protein